MKYFDDPIFKDMLVAQVCRNKSFSQVARELLTGDDFKPQRDGAGWARWVLAVIGLNFWTEYGIPPGELLSTEVEKYISKNRVGKSRTEELREYVNRIGETSLEAGTAIEQNVLQFKNEQRKASAIERMIELQSNGQLDDEKMLELCREAINVQGGTQASSRIPDIWEVATPQIEWAIPDLLPMASITLVSGKPGDFKTWFAIAEAKAIAHGGKFLNRQASCHSVIYFDRENPVGVVRQRLDDLEFKRTKNFLHWGLHCEPEPPSLEIPERFIQMANSFDTRPVFIFDSLLRFHAADSENAASDMAPVMAALRKIASTGAGVLVLHHRGKNSDSEYRGSSEIQAAVDLSFLLRKEGNVIRLESTKSRMAENFTLTMRFDLDSGGFSAVKDPLSTGRETDMLKIEEYIRANPNNSQSQIVEAFRSSMPASRVRELLVEGNDVRWDIIPGARNKMTYRLVS